MLPIKDISELQAGTIVYHPVFGFAAIRGVGRAEVAVRWVKSAPTRPRTLSKDDLVRAYAWCQRDSFFDQTFRDLKGMAYRIQEKPFECLTLLLAQLVGPHTPEAITEWLTTWNLLPEDHVNAWWKQVWPKIIEHPDYAIVGKNIVYYPERVTDPLAPLDDPKLPAQSRLELALAHQQQMPALRFRREILWAARSGDASVRTRVFDLIQGDSYQGVLLSLLGPGPSNLEALLDFIQRDDVRPRLFADYALTGLIARLRNAIIERGPIDQIAAFAAGLVGWQCPGIDAFVVTLAGHSCTQAVVQETLRGLPGPVSYASEWLALAYDDDNLTCLIGLIQALTHATGLSAAGLADALAPPYADISTWIRTNYSSLLANQAQQAPVQQPETPIAFLSTEPTLGNTMPQPSPHTLIDLGIRMCQALIPFHNKQVVCNPSRDTVVVSETGEVTLRPAESVPITPEPEPPCAARDLYAAAGVVIETLLGQPLPDGVMPDAVLPYLRHLLDIPPSSLAPLDRALHPNPNLRPAHASAWLASWNACAQAEATRAQHPKTPQAELAIGIDTHIGAMKILRTQTNQDAIHVGLGPSMALLSVFDGISTANVGSGDLASGIASQTIGSLWSTDQSELAHASDAEHLAFLSRSFRLANRAICDSAVRLAKGNLFGQVPMGTTAVVASVRGNRVHLAWLGDSRAYLVGPYGASLLTADMNLAGERLRHWHSHLESSWRPDGFALLGYLGHFNEWSHAEMLPPRTLSFTLGPDEHLVLCTDGVTDYLAPSHPELTAMMAEVVQARHPMQAARALVTLANEGGGGDNATALVATLAATESSTTSAGKPDTPPA